MIKKYHVADLFTLLEVILACTLIVMTFQRISADYALWVFIAGELCDALDGPCARRWPYPRDGKYRWWRQPRTVQAIEHLSDILMISALALFLVYQGEPFHYITLTGTYLIFAICMLIEFQLQIRPSSPKSPSLIRFRRYVYLLGIAIGIAELIFCTSWTFSYKISACIVGVIAGILLIIAKWNRFRNRDESFRDFLRRKRQHH